jgi:ATP-dependent RNA helicase DeaD
MTDPIDLKEEMPAITYADLTPKLITATQRIGWTTLTPVQQRAIPYIMLGRDLMVQARTGSGKTGAFVLPALELINPLENNCQVLILVPTRELAVQVSTAAKTLAEGSGIRTVAVYGGTKFKPQLDAFKQGAHIVVGTPGRILDHLLRRTLVLDNLKIFTFDEADRLMSMGFYQDMKEVQSYLPKRRVHTYMFSATFPPNVRKLAERFMHEPDVLNLSSDQVHVTNTEHSFVQVSGTDKDRTLVRLIEVENPTNAIIFCNTKAKVNYVTVVLQRFGYDSDQLTSDLGQGDRERVLGRVRDGNLRFLVATDVAARGIDIPELSHVFQYEPPEDPEQYIHRAGRTGRAGASGVAITLVDVVERLKLMQIGKRYQLEFAETNNPTDDDVANVVKERAIAHLEAKLRTRDKLKTERMARFVPLAQELSESEEGLDLLAMLLDDVYHKSFHNPPPLPSRKASVGRKQTKKRRR